MSSPYSFFLSLPSSPASSAQHFYSISPHIFAAILPHSSTTIYINIASHHVPGILSLRRRESQWWAFTPYRGHWQQRRRDLAAAKNGAPGAEFSAHQ